MTIKIYICFFVILLFNANLFGQTDSLEKAALYNKLVSKELSDVDFSNLWSQWNQKMKTIKYPDLPLDQAGQVHYVFLNEFKGFSKEKLFNRTVEWLAINYGLLPVNMYSSLNEGKIIFRNSLTLNKTYSCVYTSIFSIKDEKIKLDLISLSYQAYYEADYSSGIPERIVNLNINEFYPVSIKKTSEWNLNLSLFKTTNQLFNLEIKNLVDYILSYDNSNIF
jgi:hypothetical protein